MVNTWSTHGQHMVMWCVPLRFIFSIFSACLQHFSRFTVFFSAFSPHFYSIFSIFSAFFLAFLQFFFSIFSAFFSIFSAFSSIFYSIFTAFFSISVPSVPVLPPSSATVRGVVATMFTSEQVLRPVFSRILHGFVRC